MVFDLAHGYQWKTTWNTAMFHILFISHLPVRQEPQVKEEFKYIIFHACAFKLFAL